MTIVRKYINTNMSYFIIDFDKYESEIRFILMKELTTKMTTFLNPPAINIICLVQKC